MDIFLDHTSLEGPSTLPSIERQEKPGRNVWGIPFRTKEYTSSDASLFSSSLPTLQREKYSNYDSVSVHVTNKLENLDLDTVGKESSKDYLDETGTGILLPDENDLLAGIIDDFDISELTPLDELEDYDIFGSGGGIELDSDSVENVTNALTKSSINDAFLGNGFGQYSLPNGVGTVAGEHPYGEHPSRTLFVRNINSNVEDSELRALFEQYGDIRTLYTACKHRGFVMISYYDIRAARTAMRALQSKPLRRRKLDIHFSIPKDNPSDKDLNQGTLVVFNLDSSVSNDDLRQIFGAYGEVKEIRETPHKRHHKFIEFYDVRAAEAALRSLNRSDIAGKRIKLEPSRPGGARRNLMQQISQELEQDEIKSYRHHVGSPIANSPPGTWGQFGNPGDGGPLHALSRSPTGGAFFSSSDINHLNGLNSGLLSSVKIVPIGKDQSRVNHSDNVFSSGDSPHGIGFQQSRVVSEYNSGILTNTTSSPASLSPLGASSSNTSSVGTLSGSQFLWGSQPQPQTSAWPSMTLGGHPFATSGHLQSQGFLSSSRQVPFLQHSGHHHIGSAPSGIPLDRHFGYFSESPDSSFVNTYGLRDFGAGKNEGNLMVGVGVRSPLNHGITLQSGISGNNSPSFGMISSPRLGQGFFSGAPYPRPVTFGFEGLVERGRRIENSATQLDYKRQYHLDLDKIISGEDLRTTLMIKNIPNKYTSKMLLAAIDEKHKGTYDFLYLPIDFKNKCNVGYAFINLISPSHIIPFYQALNGKKWEKFNSEKVALLAYARIQGRSALVSHFQNSSLMNEDKRCRPILFNSEGLEADDQDPFASRGLNIFIRTHENIATEDSPRSPKRLPEHEASEQKLFFYEGSSLEG